MTAAAADGASGSGQLGDELVPYGKPLAQRPLALDHTHGLLSVRRPWHSPSVLAPAHQPVAALTKLHADASALQHCVA